MNIDPTTRAVADLIADLGYAVTIQATEATTTDDRTGERFIVHGDDTCKNVCLLAERVGIDLADG